MSKHVSFSQYKMWRECGYRWELAYVEDLKVRTQSIHTIFGTAVHETLQEWLERDVFGGRGDLFISSVDLSERFKEIFIREAEPHLRIEDEAGNVTFLFSREEMEEFYQQGIEIINYVQKNHKKFFPSEDVELYGIEYELDEEVLPGVNFVGFIDVVTYNIKTDEYTLYDIKTSTRGWNKYKKSDKSTTDQVLLYKHFFARKTGVDPDKITVAYTVMKRILPEHSDYPVPRVSEFVPPHKTPSMNKAMKSFNSFLDLAFSDEGDYIKGQTPKPSRSTCRFCEFSEDGTCEYSAKKPLTKKEESQWVTLK